ncbi:MAG TPA: hypothetical protein VFA21_22820 [Pyrinomonadaceae bacterium]|jgi:hypothetical protein|nr:hypothetical protein [Pyrinomonadaceae bacterium]
MTQSLKALTKTVLLISIVAFPLIAAPAQGGVVILEGAQLTRVVPSSYYFEGQSAPTQMRNTAAAKLGADRYLIVGLVDTSGYSSDVRAKYQGFFITDSPVTVGGQQLGTGAYGFGFTDDGHLNILDLGGRQILSAPTKKDTEIKRPRPILFATDAGGIRFYSGRDYAVVSFR